jgi:hypothetical protein
MRVNENQSKNSLRGELSLCHKINRRVSLLTRSRTHSYRKAISHRNRARKLRITVKVLIDTSQVTSEASTIKIKPKKQLDVLHIFQQTSGVRDKETQLGQRELESLIR